MKNSLETNIISTLGKKTTILEIGLGLDLKKGATNKNMSLNIRIKIIDIVDIKYVLVYNYLKLKSEKP